VFKCAICSHEHWYSVPPTCRRCGSKLDAAKHDELRHLDFLWKELASDEAAALMPADVRARLLAHYQERRRGLIEELQPPRPVPPKAAAEAGPGAETKRVAPAEPSKKAEVAAPPKPPRKREPVPTAPEPRPFRPDFRRWGETVMRSLLYLGVFGLIATFLLTIYGPWSSAIPATVRLAVLILITAGIYAFGYALRYKFDLARTGLALIFLALALIPLLYLAAKRFGLLPAEHTLQEWFGVTLFCTMLYAIVGAIVGESALMYLTAFSGATTTGLLLGHLGWFDSRRFVAIALVFTLLSGLYFIISTYTSRKRRDSTPFLIASQVIMGFVLFTLMYYTTQSRYLPATAICGMITVYYAAAYYMRRVPELFYIPCASLVATTVLFTLSWTTELVWLSLAIAVPAGVYLFVGAHPAVPDDAAPKVPLRQTSLGCMAIVFTFFVVATVRSLVEAGGYVDAACIGLMVTAYFIPSATIRGKPNEAYIPCISLLATILLFTLSRTTDIVWLSLAITVVAGMYLFLSLYRRLPERTMFTLALRQTSLGAMIVVLTFFALATVRSLIEGSGYLRAAYIGLMVTAYFIPSAMVQTRPKEAYIPCISLLAAIVLFTLSRTTDIVWFAMAITVPSSAYLIISANRKIPETMLFKSPLGRTSFGAMLVVLALFGIAAAAGVYEKSYMRPMYIGLMVTAYFVTSALARAKAEEMYVPALTFTSTALLLVAQFLPRGYNVSPAWFCVPVALAGGGYVLTRFRREEYARPFYYAGYCFSYLPFAVATVGLALRLWSRVPESIAPTASWVHAPTIGAGLLIAAVFYACCSAITKESFNVYLSVGAVAGLIALVVDVSPLPGAATFMFLGFFAVVLAIFALRVKGTPWTTPFYYSGHLIAALNTLYLVWVVATDIAGGGARGAWIFPLVTAFLAMGFYLYNGLEVRQKLFAYMTVSTAYLAMAILLFTCLGALYEHARLIIAIVSLAAVGFEHRIRDVHRGLWREPLLVARNAVVGAILIQGMVTHAFATYASVNTIALYALGALTATATAVLRRDEPAARPQLHTFTGGALFFLAVWTFLREVASVPNQWMPLHVIGIAIPYLVAGRLLERFRDRTHTRMVYGLVTLISVFAIVISLPHPTTAIFTCIAASVVYGILAYFLRKDSFLYASILSFALAYLFSLIEVEVPVHAYGLYFLVIGVVLTCVGKVIRSDTTRLENNPFYLVGAVISVGAVVSAVTIASLFVAGTYSTSELNISIGVTALAALMYGIYGFFLGSRTFFLLSGSMLLGTYYLFILKYHVAISPAYTFPPAAILVGLGIAQIRTEERSAYLTARQKIVAGLVLLFLPAFVRTVTREDFFEGLLIMSFGISAIWLSVRFKIKYLFVGGMAAVAGDILLQAVRFMRSASIPKELYIGTASVILIFMGCLAERRFKEAVAGTVRRTRGKIAMYFDGWA